MSWPRARRVVALAKEGREVEEIARKLQLSPRTVVSILAATSSVIPPTDWDLVAECPCCESRMRLPRVGPGLLCLRCQVEAHTDAPPESVEADELIAPAEKLPDLPAPDPSESSLRYLARLEAAGELTWGAQEIRTSDNPRRKRGQKPRVFADPTPETVAAYMAAIRGYHAAFPPPYETAAAMRAEAEMPDPNCYSVRQLNHRVVKISKQRDAHYV